MSNPPDRSLGDHLIRVVKLLHAKKSKGDWPQPRVDVDPLTYPLMFNLWTQPCRVSDLATRLHADISTISRQVSGLDALGLIERKADPSDGRAQELHLTEDGKNLLVELRTLRDGFINRLITDWSSEEKKDFAGYLARFADSLEASMAQPTSSEDLPTDTPLSQESA